MQGILHFSTRIAHVQSNTAVIQTLWTCLEATDPLDKYYILLCERNAKLKEYTLYGKKYRTTAFINAILFLLKAGLQSMQHCLGGKKSYSLLKDSEIL